ncbi:MAG: hypothetical protein ACYDBW_10295 [Sulfuricaulis sp.]
MKTFSRFAKLDLMLRRIAIAAAVSGMSLLYGCAGYLSQSFEYQPSNDAALKLSDADARQIVSNAFSHCYDSSNRFLNFLAYRTDAVGKVEYFPDHYIFTSNKSGKGYSVYYKDMRNLKMVYHAQHEWPDYFVFSWDGRGVNTYLKKEFTQMSGSCNMIYPDGPMPFAESSKVIMDAILRLKLDFDTVYGPVGEAQFKKSADQYLATQAKPPLPEDVKIYDIQATTAVARKNFETAAALYAKALDIAPWWAADHFNRALVLGEMNATDAASIEMKRYLYLKPDAPNAEAVRRKIAEWGTPAY